MLWNLAKLDLLALILFLKLIYKVQWNMLILLLLLAAHLELKELVDKGSLGDLTIQQTKKFIKKGCNALPGLCPFPKQLLVGINLLFSASLAQAPTDR